MQAVSLHNLQFPDSCSLQRIIPGIFHRQQHPLQDPDQGSLKCRLSCL